MWKLEWNEWNREFSTKMYFIKTDYKIDRQSQQTNFHRRTWENY